MKSVSSGYGGVSKSFRIESITKYTITTINTRWEATQRGYVGKIHQTDSQNSNTTTYSGRQLYHLQFSLQSASPETFGYLFVFAPKTEEVTGGWRRLVTEELHSSVVRWWNQV